MGYPALGRRVLVLGVTGAGKSTMARRLAALLGGDYVDMDDLHWRPGWQPAPVAEFAASVTAAVAAACWVMDGNYSIVRDLVWPRAATVVWLDYSFPVVFGRLWRRTWRRLRRREVICHGNVELFRKAFFDRESIFLWQIQTFRRRRREIPALLARPEYAHLDLIHLRTPAEAERWAAETTATQAARAAE